MWYLVNVAFDNINFVGTTFTKLKDGIIAMVYQYIFISIGFVNNGLDIDACIMELKFVMSCNHQILSLGFTRCMCMGVLEGS